jgi:hypothetical protein
LQREIENVIIYKSDISKNQILSRVHIMEEYAQGQLVIILGHNFDALNKN